MNATIATIRTTKKMPTPTPALKIPSIIEQLETDINNTSNTNILVILSFIIS